jgi:hypothetical protein
LFPRFQPESVQKEIDPGFVNDQYWLVFPFHVYWDAGADVQDRGMTKLPLGKGTGRHVVVKFAGGGYTPGDTWELYLFRQPGEGIRLSPRWERKTECCRGNLDWLQESRPSPCLDRTSRHGGRRAVAPLVFECGGQAGWVGQMGGRAVANRGRAGLLLRYRVPARHIASTSRCPNSCGPLLKAFADLPPSLHHNF